MERFSNDASRDRDLDLFAGFGVGYAARAWRSRKHMRQLYAPYSSSTSRPATRRAF